MTTLTVKIEDPASFEQAVAAATAELQAGRLAAIPTETVYGLAANAFDAAAVEKIYAAKGRPSRNPLIVHVVGFSMARRCCAAWPEAASKLAAAFWPGPLTLVLPKSDEVPLIVTAGGNTVALRWPAHPVAQAIISRCGFPLAAPSANLSNQVSPTSAGHVLEGLEGRIPLILDAGPCAVGIESTVVDVSGGNYRVLRPGVISSAQISEVLGGGVVVGAGEIDRSKVLPSPGMLTRHYSPRARLVLGRWRTVDDIPVIAAKFGAAPSATHVIAHHVIPTDSGWGRVVIIPEDAEAYARALYAEMRQCDSLGPDLILVEHPPEGPEWEGVLDRLRRAAASDNESFMRP